MKVNRRCEGVKDVLKECSAKTLNLLMINRLLAEQFTPFIVFLGFITNSVLHILCSQNNSVSLHLAIIIVLDVNSLWMQNGY